MPMPITTIAFDADDTLWQNETFYRLTEQRFMALLADHAEEPLNVPRYARIEHLGQLPTTIATFEAS